MYSSPTRARGFAPRPFGRREGNVGRSSHSIAKLIRESGSGETTQMMNRPGRVDHGFVDINAMALNAAIGGSIFSVS